jgi:AcrR family transcriptional regulator
MVPKRAADRIRETAGELFYREGIRAVGVDEIVTRAGVTKPSLYRSYPSKDELAADYLRHHGQQRLKIFDDTIASGRDPRDGLRQWLKQLVERATKPDYRGCGNSNAAVEYPDHDHPARKVAAENKRRFRLRLLAIAKAMGARRPEALADALLLVIEGTFSSGQMFGPGGPARHLIETADLLIDAHLPPAAAKRRSR